MNNYSMNLHTVTYVTNPKYQKFDTIFLYLLLHGVHVYRLKLALSAQNLIEDII